MKFQATKENPAPLITIGTQLQNGPKIDLASLVIGAATIGILGVTRTLSHLWLLLTLLLFRKMKLVWHGLLTADENRYIEKRANMEASGKLLQDFIDEMESPESALIAASADGYLTNGADAYAE